LGLRLTTEVLKISQVLTILHLLNGYVAGATGSSMRLLDHLFRKE